MAGTAVLGRLTWQPAEVLASKPETGRAATITLGAPDWRGHRSGQHVDVRLTAEDGYQAVRSYSIASPPDEGRLLITVERIDEGEVSPYLVEDAQPGDQLEIRGPIGGYFVWEAAQGGPLMLVGGGSGIVPLMSMLRHRQAAAGDTPARLLYSSRSPADVIYADELESLSGRDGVDIIHTFTRSHPSGWTGYTRRVDAAMLAETVWPPEERPRIYVCGPTQFVETAAQALLDLGHTPGRIKTERFGPSGR